MLERRGSFGIVLTILSDTVVTGSFGVMVTGLLGMVVRGAIAVIPDVPDKVVVVMIDGDSTTK